MSANPPPLGPIVAARLEIAVSPERLASYRQQCGNDLMRAVKLYRWNGELSGCFWETLGHVEVLLRNTLAGRLDERQRRLGRAASWLADRSTELDFRGQEDIAKARARVRAKRKPPIPQPPGASPADLERAGARSL